MLKIVAKNHVKPDKIKAFIELCQEMVEETRKEEGCIYYDLCQDINDPSVITFLEEWESMDNLSSHRLTPHYTKLMPLLSNLTDQKMEVNLYKQLI